MRVTAGEPGSIFNDRVRGRATGLNDRPCRRAVCRFADRVGRAEVARAGNADQCREVDRSPFIDRPIEVGWLLRLHGQPDDVIAAGPLHDAHEETATTGAELQRRFGALIAWPVESGSDDPSVVDDKFRKRELRDRVAHTDSGTCAVFAADKIAKVRELALLPAGRFSEPTTCARLAHFRASLEMLHRAAGELALVDHLDAESERLVALTVTTRP